MNAKTEKLKTEYEEIASTANRFLDELIKQIKELLAQQRIPLAAQIECRVKSWLSIEEKLKRKSLKLEGIRDLRDLIGVRIILLFRRDASRVARLLTDHFTLLDREDAGTRLTEDQFGYASLHCVIELPDEWLTVPTLKPLAGLKAEIQVRTMAQHIWAAASHVLQYKQEAGVPMQLRRTVHRVSALLETVDLEFDRVLAEKEKYRESLDVGDEKTILDVVSLERITDSVLPAENKDDWEDYSSLVGELRKQGIKTQEQARQLLLKHKQRLVAYDKKRVGDELKQDYSGCESDSDRERVDRGVFFTHSGMVRTAMEFETDEKE
jgi:ppGpp synthetase/RelA/SpoT-type nucleotidyltranferase